MNKNHSYEELKNNDNFWIQATPYIAGMNETLDGSIEDEPISLFLYYESKITKVDDGHEFPFQDLRVNIMERSSEEIQSLSGKYPVGFVRFHEDDASVTLMCRDKLVSRMVSTLSMVKNNEIEFFITLPVLSNNLPNVYPVLNFQYRLRSKSGSGNS